MTTLPENDPLGEDTSITPEKVRIIREFTGEGMMACNRALKKANGNVLLAVGHLFYDGCLVNFKSGNREERLSGMARGYASELRLVDGKIRRKDPEHSEPSP